jgi:hypothetical protein
MASTPLDNDADYTEDKRNSLLDVVRENVKKQGQVSSIRIIILGGNVV